MTIHVSWHSPTDNTVKLESDPICVGIVPLRSFPPISSCCKVVIEPICAGMVPLSLLSFTLSSFSPVASPSWEGMPPVNSFCPKKIHEWYLPHENQTKWWAAEYFKSRFTITLAILVRTTTHLSQSLVMFEFLLSRSVLFHSVYCHLYSIENHNVRGKHWTNKCECINIWWWFLTKTAVW